MSRLVVISLALTLVAVAAPSPKCCDIVASRDTFESQVVSPYVEVRAKDWFGSGVVIDVRGEQLILTAAHVVEGQKKVTLYKRHEDEEMSTQWTADVVRICESADLALLRPRTPLGLTSAKIDHTARAVRGEDCWYVGSHSGVHASLEKSIINRPVICIEDKKYTLVNGNGWYGNSGGPLFVKRGGDYVLVGVIVRLAVVNPRAPLCAEPIVSISKFLEE